MNIHVSKGAAGRGLEKFPYPTKRSMALASMTMGTTLLISSSKHHTLIIENRLSIKDRIQRQANCERSNGRSKRQRLDCEAYGFRRRAQNTR